MSVLTSSEYILDLHIHKKTKIEKNFFSRMEKEELSFIFQNNDSLIS